MRKFLIAAAVATSAIVAAAPAAAQYYPQHYPPQGYGYGYGYAGHHYQARIANLRHRIDRLDARDRISDREARRLRYELRELERQAYIWSRNGLSGWERRALDQRIARLEQLIRHERRDGRWDDRRWDHDDRWEHDGRWDHDDRWEDGRWRDRNRDGIPD